MGGVFLSFTIETRHVLIPLSFPLSRPRAVGWPGVCKRRGRNKTGVGFSGHAGCQRPFHLYAAASLATMLLKTTAGKEKRPPAAVRGCVPPAFICDIFDVRSLEVTAKRKEAADLVARFLR